MSRRRPRRRPPPELPLARAAACPGCPPAPPGLPLLCSPPRLARPRPAGRPLPPHRNPVVRAARWYRGWALPGLGMFVEAWMVFSIG